MTETKTIICLANSWRPKGHCLVGREFHADGKIGDWIRPIDPDNEDAIADSMCSHINVLDKIDISLLGRQVSESHQTENWRFDSNTGRIPVKKKDALGWSQLEAYEYEGSMLWGVKWDKSHKMNHRISAKDVVGIEDSLRLIHVNKVLLTLVCDKNYYGQGKDRKRFNAFFEYKSREYRFWVTDPIYRKIAETAKHDDKIELGESYLTVSLGERLKHSCYQIVAAIIKREGMKE